MLHQLVLLLMAPVLLPQGISIRKSTPKLKEAAGPRHGIEGQGKPLRLLLIGDSAAAGLALNINHRRYQGSLLARYVINLE